MDKDIRELKNKMIAVQIILTILSLIVGVLVGQVK